MVGDRYTDMAGGNANQVKTLGVTYGFGDVAELRSSNATALVASPAELPAGVAKLLRV
ncbi:HAD hydrolase-like protein [Secundilactobacillus silagei]|nr:HAD hydrolase-like protein [Secundilactobacillus silagei]